MREGAEHLHSHKNLLQTHTHRSPTPSAPLSLCTQHHCPTACGWHGQLPLPPSPPGSLISFT